MAQVDWSSVFSGGGKGGGRSASRSSRSSSGGSGVDWGSVFGGETAAAPLPDSKPKSVGSKSFLDVGPIKAVRDLAGDTGNAVMKGLSALDIPRAAIVAGTNELMDLADRGARQDGARIQDTGFNLGDVIANTKNHIGVGDIIEQRGGSDLNPWLKRGLGFVGDVALDPLTYVTFGAATAGTGGSRIAGRIATKQAVARQLVDLSDDAVKRIAGTTDTAVARERIRDISDKVLRDGTGRLPKAAANELGLKVGMNFAGHTTPFTATLADTVAKGSGKAKRRIAGTFTKNMKPETRMKWERIPGFHAMRQHGGETNAFLYGLGVTDAVTKSRNFKAEYVQKFGRLLSDHDGAEWPLVRDLVEHRATGGTAREAAAARETRDLLAEVAEEFNRLTGRNLPTMDTYFPRKVTEEFREILAQNKGRWVTEGSPLRKRILKPGEEFAGETLVDGTVDEIQRIARAKFGDDAVQIFSDDAKDVFMWYVIGLERAIMQERALLNFANYGVKGFHLIDVPYLTGLKKGRRRAIKQVGRLANQAQAKQKAAGKKAARAAAKRAKGEDLLDEAAAARVVRDDADWDAAELQEAANTAQEAELAALIDMDGIPEGIAAEFNGLPQSTYEPAEAATVMAADVARRAEPRLAEPDALRAQLEAAQQGTARTVEETVPPPADVQAAIAAARQSVEEAQGRLAAEQAAPVPTREVTETVTESVPSTPPAELESLRADLAGVSDEVAVTRASAKEMRRRIREHDDFAANPTTSKKSLLRGEQFDQATPILDDYPSLIALQDLDPAEQLEHVRRLIDELPERDSGKLRTAVKNAEERTTKATSTTTGDNADAFASLQAQLLRANDEELADGFLTRTEHRAAKKEIEEGRHASLQALKGTSRERLMDDAAVGKSEAGRLEKAMDDLHSLYDEGLEIAEKARIRRAEEDWLRTEVKAGSQAPEVVAELARRRRQALRDLRAAKLDVAKAWMRQRDLKAAIKGASNGSKKVERVITRMVPDTQVRNDRLNDLRQALVEAEQQLAAAQAKDVPTTVKREVRKVNQKKVESIKAELGRATRRKQHWDRELNKAKEIEAEHWNSLSSLETAAEVRAEDLRDALNDRLVDAEDRIAAARGQAKAALEARADALGTAREFADKAAKHQAKGEDVLAQAAKLEALSLSQRAEAGTLLSEADRTFIPRALTGIEEQMLAMTDIMGGRLQRFAGRNPEVWAEPEMAQIVDAMFRLQKRDTPGALAKAFDTMQSRWKAQALLSPGYHIRNSQTAVFMNWMAGMENRRYGQFAANWRRLIKADGDPAKIKAALDSIKDPDLRDAMRVTYEYRGSLFGDAGVDANAEILMQQGFGSGGLMRGGPDSVRARFLDPTSLEWRPYKWNFKTAGIVERTIRGPLFIDGLLKGMSPDESLARVVLHHFDYSDLSHMEIKYLKRLVPFYTWTRKNVPVMLEYMARKPGAFMWYLHAQRNLEMGVPEDEVVPGYFLGAGAIRSPFTTGGLPGFLTNGNDDRIYAAPDLPFLNLNEVAETGTLMGQVSPIIKLPYEITAGKRTFQNIPFTGKVSKAPDSWDWFMPVLQAVSGEFGMPTIIKRDGEYLLSDADAYKIEQAQPLLGRVRRLLPSEDRYSDRRFTSVMSVIFGFGSFTNGEREQGGELAGREARLREASKRESQIEQALNPSDTE